MKITMARPDQPLDGDERPRESSSGRYQYLPVPKHKDRRRACISPYRSPRPRLQWAMGFAGVALTRLALDNGRGMARRSGLWTTDTGVAFRLAVGVGSVREPRLHRRTGLFTSCLMRRPIGAWKPDAAEISHTRQSRGVACWSDRSSRGTAVWSVLCVGFLGTIGGKPVAAGRSARVAVSIE
jgi:hypothetical protein